jgi:hypothetical protein
MRRLMTTAALGCLAVATAADANVAGAGRSPCSYYGPDSDTSLEFARLDRVDRVHLA